MRLLLVGLLCPALTGCLAFGGPVVCRTPAVRVDAPDVRAFQATTHVTRGGFLIAGYFQIDHDVREVPAAEVVAASAWDAHFDYSYLLFPIAGSRARDRALLLYRPGYRTVEIPAQRWWQSLGQGALTKVTWAAAPDLVAQREAVEKLVPDGVSYFYNAEVLRFAAGEYTRLASSPLAAGPDQQRAREQLIRRAKEYEDRAHDLAERARRE